MPVRCRRHGRGLAGLAGLELVAGTGAGTGAGKKAEEKKTGLDTSKTLRGESAIALRYRQHLAGQGEQS